MEQMTLSRSSQPTTMDLRTGAIYEWMSLICYIYWASLVQIMPLGSTEAGHLLQKGSSRLLGWSSDKDMQGVLG